MTKLISDIKSFDLLDPVEKKIYTAVSSPKFRDLPAKKIADICTEIVSGAVAFKGQNMETQDKITLGTTLAYDLKHRYGILNEIDARTAIDEGLHKKFGEYYGLNMSTFSDWLDKIEKIKRSMRTRYDLEQADDHRKKEEARMIEAHKLTPVEKSKEFYDTLVSMIEAENKMPAGYAYNKCWMYMEEEGLINMSQAEKDVFIEEIRIVIKKEAEAKRKDEIGFNYTNYVDRLSQPNNLAEKCRFEAVKKYFQNKLDSNESDKV